MSEPGKPQDDGAKREILRPGDSLLDVSKDADDRAEAAARAARRALEDRDRQKLIEHYRKLGWFGRLWRDITASFARLWATVSNPFQRLFPKTSAFIARMASIIGAITYATDVQGRRRLSLFGKLIVLVIALLIVWPLFKVYYVLGTTREFRGVDITFKQIITHERYLVFGNYTDQETGEIEEMAFNITDSWAYWNWTPDLMFAQVPVVGKCDFETYGWYIRVPRFVPFAGRTLLAEPVIIAADCKTFEGRPTGPTPIH
jgi:hypothetical protein